MQSNPYFGTKPASFIVVCTTKIKKHVNATVRLRFKERSAYSIPTAMRNFMYCILFCALLIFLVRFFNWVVVQSNVRSATLHKLVLHRSMFPQHLQENHAPLYWNVIFRNIIFCGYDRRERSFKSLKTNLI